jgi:TRAP-type C4-dicarboxylate transport system permease small subunit
METITTALINFLTRIIAILIAAMALIVIANVFSRYMLHFSLKWSAEAARYCMVWAAFLGAVILVHKGEHLAVDLLEKSLSGMSQKILKVIIILGSIIFFTIQTFYGVILVFLTRSQVASSIRVLPMNVVYAIIPISGLLMIFVSIVNLYRLLAQQR